MFAAVLRSVVTFRAVIKTTTQHIKAKEWKENVTATQAYVHRWWADSNRQFFCWTFLQPEGLSLKHQTSVLLSNYTHKCRFVTFTIGWMPQTLPVSHQRFQKCSWTFLGCRVKLVTSIILVFLRLLLYSKLSKWFPACVDGASGRLHRVSADRLPKEPHGWDKARRQDIHQLTCWQRQRFEATGEELLTWINNCSCLPP